MSVTRGCARSAQLLRVWISDDAGATWRDLGLICLPPGGPVTIKLCAPGSGRQVKPVSIKPASSTA
jgi:hypothetical protein